MVFSLLFFCVQRKRFDTYLSLHHLRFLPSAPRRLSLWGIFLSVVFVVVVYPVAVGAENYALLFDFLVRLCVAFVFYQRVYVLLVWVVAVHVVKIHYGGV